MSRSRLAPYLLASLMLLARCSSLLLAPSSLLRSSRLVSVLVSPAASRAYTSSPLLLRGGADDEDKASFPTWSFNEACTAMTQTPLPLVAFSTAKNAAPDLTIFCLAGTDTDKAKSTLPLTPAATAFDSDNGNALSSLLATHSKKLASGSAAGAFTPTLSIPSASALSSALVYSLGPGPKAAKKDASPLPEASLASSLGKFVASTAASSQAKTITLSLPEGALASPAEVSAFASAVYAAMYKDTRYRASPPPDNTLESIHLEFPSSAPPGADAALADARHYAAGVYLTKDIVNSPPNILNPYVV